MNCFLSTEEIKRIKYKKLLIKGVWNITKSIIIFNTDEKQFYYYDRSSFFLLHLFGIKGNKWKQRLPMLYSNFVFMPATYWKRREGET